MNIFIFISLIIIVYSFLNYRKAFILFLIFRLFLNQNINLVNIPGVPLLTLEFTLCFLFWILYLFQKRYLEVEKTPFPLKIAFLFIGVSYTASTFWGIAELSYSISKLIKIIIEEYISIWLIWQLLIYKKDYIYLIKGVTIIFAIASIYGLYESITQTNPLAAYEFLISGGGERALDWNYANDLLRGYRIKSIFFHSIGAGLNFGMFFLLILYLFTFYKNKLFLNYKYYMFVSILAIINMFLTNSRGPIIFTLVGIIPFILSKKNITFYLILFSAIVFISFYQETLFQNILSIFSSANQAKVGGSNLELRLSQFDAAFEIFKNYAFLGIGLKGFEFYSNKVTIVALFGLESLWLWVLVQQGFLGIITTLYLVYSVIYKIGIRMINIPIIFFGIAYFITYTITSLPGFLTYIFYTLIFLFYKINNNSLK